jgi:glycosyltransferase involved in cell wall biosynthesis
MKPLRLALITRRFWPLMGGAEVVMANLGVEFRRMGHQVILLTAQWEPEWPVDLVHREVPVHRLHNPRQRGWGTWRYMAALRHWLRTHHEQLDAVFVSMLKHDAYVAVRTLRDTSCRVILRAEGGGETGDCHWQQHARFGRRIRRVCQSADAIIAPSPAIRDELLGAEYASERVHFVANGVPPAPPRDDNRQAAARTELAEANWDLHVPQDEPLALYTGRLHQDKGLLDLVDAWRIVVRSHPHARLWLVGEGPLREQLYQCISDLDLRRNVLLPGVFDDVSGLLAAANLFVLPSYQEGMSISLLEAMAAQLACVASDIPGNRQLIVDQRHGLLVPPRRPDELAQAILALIANPLRCRQLGAAAARQVTENFSVAQAAQAHLNIASGA